MGTELWATSQTKAPPLPADVLESLQSTLDATHQQMLHKLQEVDKYKSGKASLNLNMYNINYSDHCVPISGDG